MASPCIYLWHIELFGQILKAKLATKNSIVIYVNVYVNDYVNLKIKAGIAAGKVEINLEEWDRFNDPKLRELVDMGMKKLGYHYSSLDIRGYRPDSMDESCNTAQQQQ